VERDRTAPAHSPAAGRVAKSTAIRSGDISQRQNDPFQLLLLRAATVLHGRARTVEAGRWTLAVLVGAGTVAALAFVEAQAVAAALAAVYAVGGELVATLLQRRLSIKAALVQEQFDTSLFGLEWTADRPPIAVAELALLASRYRGADEQLRDWYFDVSSIPEPMAGVLCQRQTLTWDLELRQDWMWHLTAGIAGYLAAIYVVGLVLGMSVAMFSIWLVAPALPALVALASSILQHRDSISTRHRALWLLDRALNSASAAELGAVSQTVQTAIFSSRCAAPRVPNRFFQGRRAALELGAEIEADALRARWGRP